MHYNTVNWFQVLLTQIVLFAYSYLFLSMSIENY